MYSWHSVIEGCASGNQWCNVSTGPRSFVANNLSMICSHDYNSERINSSTLFGWRFCKLAYFFVHKCQLKVFWLEVGGSLQSCTWNQSVLPLNFLCLLFNFKDAPGLLLVSLWHIFSYPAAKMLSLHFALKDMATILSLKSKVMLSNYCFDKKVLEFFNLRNTFVVALATFVNSGAALLNKVVNTVAIGCCKTYTLL